VNHRALKHGRPSHAPVGIKLVSVAQPVSPKLRCRLVQVVMVFGHENTLERLRFTNPFRAPASSPNGANKNQSVSKVHSALLSQH